MYMQGFRCIVTGSSGRTIKYPAVPPQWCEEDPASCVGGPKQVWLHYHLRIPTNIVFQMIYWSQAEGNNVEVNGNDKFGNPKSPAYNANMGFENGAWNEK